MLDILVANLSIKKGCVTCRFQGLGFGGLGLGLEGVQVLGFRV